MEKSNHKELAIEHLQAWLDDLYQQAEKIVEAALPPSPTRMSI